MSGNDLSFSIDPVVCMQAHGDLDRAGKKLLSLLADIENDASPLVSTWTGAAQEAYTTRQRQWHSDAEVIVGKLQQITAGLEQAVQIYANADKRGVDLITGGR